MDRKSVLTVRREYNLVIKGCGVIRCKTSCAMAV